MDHHDAIMGGKMSKLINHLKKAEVVGTGPEFELILCRQLLHPNNDYGYSFNQRG